MTPSHVLDDVESLVRDVGEHAFTPGQALAILRSRGLTPDPDALKDAWTAFDDVADFQFRGSNRDPYDYCGTGPRPGYDAWQDATDRAQDNLSAALRVLARRAMAVAV